MGCVIVVTRYNPPFFALYTGYQIMSTEMQFHMNLTRFMCHILNGKISFGV